MGGGRTGILRRLSLDEPSLTVLTTPQMKQTDRCHPIEIRPFTFRENARIQSFPDEWCFIGSLASKYRQIGNAVPCNLAKEIGIEIINTLNRENNEVKQMKFEFNDSNMSTNDDYILKFISKENFEKHVYKTLSEYNDVLKSINLKEFNRNIIDPIKLLFDKNVFNKSFEEIITLEIHRQRDKSNNNSIGYFHQNIFKYIEKCEVPENGWDIIFNKKYYIEMKNKHNTMNSSSSAKTYMRMQNQLLSSEKSICALVEVISTKSQNIPWVVTIDNIKQLPNERLRKISID